MPAFDTASLTLLLRLIASHVLADFALQRAPWVEERWRRRWTSIWLYAHSALSALLAYLFAGVWRNLWLPLAVFVTHLLLDGWKAHRGPSTRAFVLDQIGHLLVLIVLWAAVTGLGWSRFVLSVSPFLQEPRFWIYLLAYATVFWPAGIFVAQFTRAWRPRPGTVPLPASGLERAGLWIGRLERILVLTSVLLARMEFIGFLIAAKSVLRFGGLKSDGPREHAEYVLIGTLMSFTLAIGVGLLCIALADALPR